MYHETPCSPELKPCNIHFEVCPIQYSLKDTTFYLFLSLANENLSHRFMNLQMFICLFDLREEWLFKDYFSYVESSTVCKNLRKRKVW